MSTENLWNDIYNRILRLSKQMKIPLEIARRKDVPSPPVGVGKALFGLPVIVIEPQGGVFRGQYVTHVEYESPDGDSIWVIRTGLFSIMAVFVDDRTGYRAYYPFAENGLLTAVAPTVMNWIQRGYDNYGRRFAGYFEAVGNFRTGFIECYRSDILYLDMVTQGKLPMILVDKYRILRSLPPSEFIEEFASLQFTVRELTRQKVEYEKRIRRMRLLVHIRESEYSVLREDLNELKNILRTLIRENERLREELERRDIRARFREVSLETYESLIEGYERNLQELQELFQRVSSIEERVASIMKPASPREAVPPEEEEERRRESERTRYLRVGGEERESESRAEAEERARSTPT